MWVAYSDLSIVAVCSAQEKALIDCPLTCPAKYRTMLLTWQEVRESALDVLEVVHKSDAFFGFEYEIFGKIITRISKYITTPGVHEFTADDLRIASALNFYSTDLQKANFEVEFYCKDEDGHILAQNFAQAIAEFPHADDEDAIRTAMRLIYCNYLADLNGKESAVC